MANWRQIASNVDISQQSEAECYKLDQGLTYAGHFSMKSCTIIDCDFKDKNSPELKSKYMMSNFINITIISLTQFRIKLLKYILSFPMTS